MQISSNPLARKPGNTKNNSWAQLDQASQRTDQKCLSLSAHALVSVTGGPFEVYDVTSNTYNVLPPLVIQMDYQWREDIKIFDLGGPVAL